MSASTSIGTMIIKLSAMVGTNDLDARSSAFVEDMFHKTDGGKDTRRLSENQVKYITDLHGRHFA